MQLSRERLERIFVVVERQGGEESIRKLQRNFSILRSEIEEAATLGWISIEKRKPKTGRPAIVARRLSKNVAAKLPPWRYEIEKPIKWSHQKFAMFSVNMSIKGGGRISGLPGYVEAYRKAFPAAKSRDGIYASCSRLLRHPNVFAARQWYYANTCGEIPRHWDLPDYESEIWQHLEIYGSWRAKYKPTFTHRYTERRW
jgi:hypothetical protein